MFSMAPAGRDVGTVAFVSPVDGLTPAPSPAGRLWALIDLGIWRQPMRYFLITVAAAADFARDIYYLPLVILPLISPRRLCLLACFMTFRFVVDRPCRMPSFIVRSRLRARFAGRWHGFTRFPTGPHGAV